MATTSRKESDQRYEKKLPQVPVRMSQELKDRIPNPKSTWIRELIEEELGSDSRITDNDSRNMINSSRITELREYLIFFFNFFQKNASNIEITDLEKEKIKNILGVLKSE